MVQRGFRNQFRMGLAGTQTQGGCDAVWNLNDRLQQTEFPSPHPFKEELVACHLKVPLEKLPQ